MARIKKHISIVVCIAIMFSLITSARATEDSLVLPDGYEQLYYSGETVITLPLNSGILLAGSLFTDNASTMSLDMGAYSLSLSSTDGSLGVLNYPPPGCVLDSGSSAVAGSFGWLYAEPSNSQGTKYAIRVQVAEDAGGGSGGPHPDVFPGSDGPEPESQYIIRQSSDLTDDDMILESGLVAGPIPFVIEVDGEPSEYYMGITQWTTAQVSDAAGNPFALESEESAGSGVSCRYRSIGFWKVDNKGNTVHVKGEELQTILGAFENENGNSTLSLELKARTNVGQSYPTVWDCAEYASSDWPCAKVYGFAVGEGGRWIYTATGTLKDGTVITARSGFYRSYMALQTFDAAEIAAADVVEAVNEWFAAVAHEDNSAFDPEATYQAILPATNLSGVIYVPEGINASITCAGIAELTGGVHADGNCTVVNIAFVGAGKDRSIWPDGSPNKGLYGKGGGEVQNCSFTGYDCAVESSESSRLALYNSRFSENKVSVLAGENLTNVSNGNVRNCYFVKNDTAFVLASSLAVDYCNISETCFIDNDCDIKNTSGRKCFVTGNYFEHDGNTTEIVDTGKWTKGPVYICPVYTVYEDGNFYELYWGKNATMSNRDTGNYPIPKSKLNGVITVIDQPDTAEETSVTFDFSGEETQAVSMLRLRRAAEETFDATVNVEKTDSSITLTINAIPSDKIPTITVPCGDWYDAKVVYEGNTVESTYSSGNVSFTAEQGGIYTVEQIEAEPEIYVPIIPMFTTNVIDSQNGTVSLSTMHAFYGNTITFTVTPNNGYIVTAVTVTDIWGNQLTVTDNGNNTYSFQMPYCSANVSVSYTVDLPYADISADHENFDAIAYMYENGLMIGTGDGTMFEPEIGLTRAMAATILYRIAGEPPVTYSGVFQDVAAEKWYTDAVEWAVLNGVVYGVGDDRFDPNGQLSHEQILVMLYRLAGSPSIETDLFENQLDKSVVSKWAVDAVCWAIQENILTVGSEFDLTSAILRGEIAELLVSYLNH